MVSILKVVGVMSCGFMLCLGLSNAAQADNAPSAADKTKADQSDRRQGGQEGGKKQMNDRMEGSDSKGGKTIKGEGLNVEGDNSFVKGQDGKNVRLRTDQPTEKMKNSAPKNDTGDGNEPGRTTDSPLESGKPGSLGQ